MKQNNTTFKTRYVYAEGVNSPEYMVYQGRKYLFTKDHRGSINQVVDSETGEIKQKIRYSEWGEVLEDTYPGFQPFGFAGGLYDNVTKLYRFGVRDYDPEIGRWLSKDPIRFNGGDTNLYGYVLNDPINLIDPKGEVWWVLVVAIIIDAFIPADTQSDVKLPRIELKEGNPGSNPGSLKDIRKYEKKIEDRIRKDGENPFLKSKCITT